MHFLDKKADDNIEKWKSQSSGCALMGKVQSNAIVLVFKMTLHAFKRYWRFLWLCFILTGIFWLLYIVFDSEPPIEIREEAPVVYEKTIFHQSLNEQMPLFRPKQKSVEGQEQPSNSPISQQSKHIKIEKRIDPADTKKSEIIQQKIFDKTSNDIKLEQNNESIEIIAKKPAAEIHIKESNKKSDTNSKLSNNLLRRPALKQMKKTTKTLIHNKNKHYPNYYDDDNLRPNWKFNISRHYRNKLLNQWTEPIKVDIANLSAPGENGTGFSPLKEEEELMNELKNDHNFNVLASDRISLRRSLPDFRSPECRNLTYPENLPTVSIVIVFHNEIWSTLFRTVWSIIDRSPAELIEEIILVDDASTWIFLQRPLDDYVKTLPAKVNVIRIPKRQGLIRARLIGAKAAKGSVLTFFDAHMECLHGWLPPILSRISDDRSVVVVPKIDGIDSNDMKYLSGPGLEINGLRWHLVFLWMNVPQRELKRTHNDPTAPIRIPTHVGCAFSIDREFFFEIGSYDEGMDIWGSENVELAFRVWLCGGALEVLPCSRVAHLYRVSTYSFNGNAALIKDRNNNRLVEVWMDNKYKEYYYAANPAARKIPPGNLTERFRLKNRLQCKNFQWYLDNIYPESNWRREYKMMGELKNEAEKTCMDVFTTALFGKVIVYPCHGGGGNQFFAFEKLGQIISAEELCLGINNNKSVVLVKCSEEDKLQYWDLNKNEKWIVHRESGFCMQSNKSDVILGPCNSTDIRTKWDFKSTWLKKVPKAEHNTLRKKLGENRLINQQKKQEIKKNNKQNNNDDNNNNK